MPENAQGSTTPFLTDVATLRERARKHMDAGAVTANYGADPNVVVKVLNEALATEIVCVLRYKRHYYMAEGIASESVKQEFNQHATEEQAHAKAVAERINQLGGKPNFNPEGLATRSASQYVEAANLVEMIKENLIAERIACDHYRELIRFFADKDPTTRVMMEGILSKEEEHANDMLDLLAVHQGKPMHANG